LLNFCLDLLALILEQLLPFITLYQLSLPFNFAYFLTSPVFATPLGSPSFKKLALQGWVNPTL